MTPKGNIIPLVAAAALAAASLSGTAVLLPASASAHAVNPIANPNRPALVNKRVKSSGMYSVTLKVTTDRWSPELIDYRVAGVSHRAWKRAGTLTVTLKQRVMVHGRKLSVSTSAKNASTSVAVSWRAVEPRRVVSAPRPTRSTGTTVTATTVSVTPPPALNSPVASAAPGPGTAGGTGTTSGSGSTGGAGSTGGGSTGVQPNAPVSVGALVFDDEFSGSGLDGSKWSSSWFGGGAMNNVSTSPGNVSVANGVLSLTLSSASSGALVSTNPNGGAGTGFQFTYGYTEARIWLPGSGSTVSDWPAFWTDGQSWPANGESDIVEGLGGATSNYHSPLGANNSGTIAGTWSGGWHTYGLDRQPGVDTIYWDGSVVRSYTPDDGGAPQYLILNIGGGSTIGATMQVDYVRAWTD